MLPAMVGGTQHKQIPLTVNPFSELLPVRNFRPITSHLPKVKPVLRGPLKNRVVSLHFAAFTMTYATNPTWRVKLIHKMMVCLPVCCRICTLIVRRVRYKLIKGAV
jgi:hypothetical protein